MAPKGAKARTAQKEGSSKKNEGRRRLQNGVPYTVVDRVLIWVEYKYQFSAAIEALF